MKEKFDQMLIEENKNFIENYQNSLSEILEDFKLLLKSINSQVRI